MLGSLMDAVVQAMSASYEPNQIWPVVNILLPFLLFGPLALIALSVGGRIIRKWRAH